MVEISGDLIFIKCVWFNNFFVLLLGGIADKYVQNRYRKLSPPTGGFFLTPAEGCSLWLKQVN